MKVGLAADHGGVEMKQQLAKLILAAMKSSISATKYTMRTTTIQTSPFPSRAVSRGDVERGVLLCGSGVGASVAANKIVGVRAAVCHDDVSARQGVEDDDLNIRCFGGRTTGLAVAWDCTKNFLAAKFSGAERHRRRLAKVVKLEAAWMPIVTGCREDR